MTLLLVTVLYGLAFAYVAVQNTAPTTLQVGSFVFANVPLYIIVLGSLLLGVLLSGIISFIDSLSTMFALRSREHKIVETSKTAHDLEKRVRELEIENTRLKTESHYPKTTLLERVKQNLSS